MSVCCVMWPFGGFGGLIMRKQRRFRAHSKLSPLLVLCFSIFSSSCVKSSAQSAWISPKLRCKSFSIFTTCVDKWSSCRPAHGKLSDATGLQPRCATMTSALLCGEAFLCHVRRSGTYNFSIFIAQRVGAISWFIHCEDMKKFIDINIATLKSKPACHASTRGQCSSLLARRLRR